MQLVMKAGAWSNGEVAYIAWEVEEKIKDCLGFMITRVHESGPDKGQRRVLPTWVAFKDQSNPNWNEQDTSVWPIQRFEWRDLTLRKSRDSTDVRPIDFRVHYEIVPVGFAGDGRKEVPASETAPEKDANGEPSFEGPHHQLFQIGEPTSTNAIDVTHDYGEIAATFTNGILSTQNLVRQLESVNKGPPKKVMEAAKSPDKKTRIKAAQDKETHLLSTLKKEIVKPKSKIRAFLTGDVFAFVTQLIERAEKDKGHVYLALYELHDEALIDVLLKAMKKGLIHIILSTAGNTNPNPKGTPKKEKQPIAWDTENDDPRRKLHALAKGKLKDAVIDRMFNTNARIGHNKFAVLTTGKGDKEKAVAVLSGSTNWTETGLCTQSNNSLIINNAKIASDYWNYWKRLRDDKQPKREALTVTVKGKKIRGAKANSAKQSPAIRKENPKSALERTLGGNSGTAQLWGSPNTAKTAVPKDNPAVPPDLSVVYDLMEHARQAIMFLTFLPGLSGKNNIIGKAAELTARKKDLFVMGAVSDPKALPPPSKPEDGPTTFKDAKGKERKIPPPAIWWPFGEQSRIAMIRAAAVRIPFGNLRPELLTAGHAIIHDKIIVIDPLDEENCAVITGSHNLGFKASYCNDDNLLIVRKNRDLAISYAVHVFDLYDHYVMRARLEENLRRQLMEGKIHSFEEAAGAEKPGGLLRLDSDWQDKHFNPHTPSALDYFLRNTKSGGSPVPATPRARRVA